MAKAPFDKSRRDWGARKAKRSRKAPASYTHLEVHHTASPSMAQVAGSPPAKILQGIQRYHMDNLSWNDIFYNGFVMADGKVWEGRPDTPNGAYRLCFLGNFEIEQPTPDQLETLRRYDGMFEGETDTHTWRAAGTRFASACPGDNMIQLVERLLTEDKKERVTPMTKTQAEEIVERTYVDFLGRPSDEGGKAFWTKRLLGPDFTVTDLRFSFLVVRLAADAAERDAISARLDGRGDLGLDTAAVKAVARDSFYEELRKLAQ